MKPAVIKTDKKKVVKDNKQNNINLRKANKYFEKVLR